MGDNINAALIGIFLAFLTGVIISACSTIPKPAGATASPSSIAPSTVIRGLRVIKESDNDKSSDDTHTTAHKILLGVGLSILGISLIALLVQIAIAMKKKKALKLSTMLKK